MAKIPSKPVANHHFSIKPGSSIKSKKLNLFPTRIKRNRNAVRDKWKAFRKDRFMPHKTFKRSYREDYLRQTKTPGLLSHAMTTFQLIFKHWKTFSPMIGIMSVMYIALVGLLSEDVYQQFQDSDRKSVV